MARSNLKRMIIKGGMTGDIVAFFMCCETAAEGSNLKLWVTPAGGYIEQSAVQQLADDYHAANSDVNIEIRILDAETGDDEITAAMGTEDAPDIVLSSPESIVTEWGSAGYMADLRSLWDEQAEREIDGEIREACVSRDGIYYQMPLFRDVYTMAINYDIFKKTSVLQYLNEDAHSWKDSGFIDCVLVMHDYFLQKEDKDIVVGKIPCKDRREQRFFMSFITNLSNGHLVNDERTAYKISSSSIRNSFAILSNLRGKGISYDPKMSSEDEMNRFLEGKLPITFFWSYYKHQKFADQADFIVFPMMYPNSKNSPVLTGDICGFGVVDNKDEQKIQDAMEFVRFVTADAQEYEKAVSLSGCFPVRSSVYGDSVSGLYRTDEDSRLFRFFMEYFKDYEATMPLFSEMEDEWYDLVRQIAGGGKIKPLTTAIDEKLNKKLEEDYGIVEVVLE